MSLESDVAKLLKLVEQQREAQQATPAISHEEIEADAAATAVRWTEDLIKRHHADVDIAGVRQSVSLVHEPDSLDFNKILAEELRRLYIEWRQANPILGVDVWPERAQSTPLPEPEDDPEQPPRMPKHHEPELVVPPAQSPAAVRRAQAGPPAIPCERDRILIEEGQARERAAKLKAAWWPWHEE